MLRLAKETHGPARSDFRLPAVRRRNGQRRGSALLMALMYVTLFGALAASMTLFTSATLEISAGNERSTRAYAAAESGMTFLNLQFKQLAKPITAQGTISTTLARTLFSGAGGIAPKLAAQLNGTINLQGRTVIWNAATIRIPPINMYSSIDDTCFTLQIDQDAANPLTLHLTSTGKCSGVLRSVTMNLTMEKKLKYAVYSNIAIQLGKNVVVEGDVCSTIADFSKGPPVWTLTDFRDLTNMAALDTDLANFRTYIKGKDPNFDNRLDVRSAAAASAAAAQGFHDKNGDGFIDDWDLFLNRVDTNGDGAVSTGEFTDPHTGLPYDAQLFALIDSLSPPFGTETPRAGYNDGLLDGRDAYAKVKGNVMVEVTQSAWDTWAKDTSSSGGAKYGVGFGEQFQGPVTSPDPTVPPVQFGIDSTDVPVIKPSDFDTSSYATQAGAAGKYTGAIPLGATVSGYVVSGANANNGTVTEGQPQGAASPQSTYKRPVFKNVHFVNCKIAKGTNALFQNCTFDGVTYVDMNANVVTGGSVGTLADGTKGIVGGTPTTDPSSGNAWAQKMISGTFSNTTPLTASNSVAFNQGNNLRFDTCTMNGPLAAAVPTAYTHFANNWEFSGSTVFNNTYDQTATILAPNTNVDCGSFLAPPTGPLPSSSMVGVVVAGNVNMRGAAWLVDGSIIITGNGGMNTTLSYFGPADAATDPNAVPIGGFGRIYLRYNPSRSMPNGISIPISLTPVTTSYSAANIATWGW